MERIFRPFETDDPDTFKRKVLCISQSTPHALLLESNDYDRYPYSNFGFFAAIGSLASFSGKPGGDFLRELGAFHREQADWMFGYLSYDLKNEIESGLHSDHPNRLGEAPGHFFIPKYLFRFHEGKLELGVCEEVHREEITQLFHSVVPADPLDNGDARPIEVEPRLSRTAYLKKIRAVQAHIRRGDVYEMNFCMEFFREGECIRPPQVFRKLNQMAKAPFTAYLRQDDLYLLCSSPERYLKKWQQQVISQPIKGTIRRDPDQEVDAGLRERLRWDSKERSENVMIVDLVRNDLSRIAKKGSVTVEELFGIYTFEQVHQMISTVTCNVPSDINFTEVIRATFPMGSMTGAPKYRAMELIEALENSRRGLYSGAVGYITPQGNFDFNVVIRSILYNAARRYTSVHVGSAITIDSDPEREYEECLLKGNAMMEALRF